MEGLAAREGSTAILASDSGPGWPRRWFVGWLGWLAGWLAVWAGWLLFPALGWMHGYGWVGGWMAPHPLRGLAGWTDGLDAQRRSEPRTECEHAAGILCGFLTPAAG